MLTFRTFEAGAPSTAIGMARHVLTQTLPAAEVVKQDSRQRLFGYDPSYSTAIVRQDLDPRLTRILGIAPGVVPTPRQFAALLAGRHTDGSFVEGRQMQSACLSLAEELGLSPKRVATVDEATAILAGIRADDGKELPFDRRHTLRKRFLALHDLDSPTSDTDALSTIAQATNAKGHALNPKRYAAALEACHRPLGHLHLCFSAEKDVSIAWAVAQTDDERALYRACHETAVTRAMCYVEGAILGSVRRGKAGSSGSQDASIAYVAVTHFTGRPSRAVGDESGHVIRLPGDPQIHSHVCVPNAAMTDDGHIGAINLASLGGRVHQIGALYSAFVADGLRALGVKVAYDREHKRLHLECIPDHVRSVFSKRTVAGVKDAQTFAGLTDDEWAALWPPERTSRAKRGVQGDPRGFKNDDVADFGAWKAQAHGIGWTPRSGLDLDRSTRIEDREARIAVAVSVAAQHLEADATGKSVGRKQVWLAATRGLLAAGIDDAIDIAAVASRLEGRMPDNRDVAAAAEKVVEDERRTAARVEADVADVQRSAAVLAGMHRSGAARLVDGGELAVVAATAELWIEAAEAAPADSLPTVGVGTARMARMVTDAVRQRRRETGALQADRFEFECIDEMGQPSPTTVAIGDPVLLTGRTGEDFKDRKRGVASVRAGLQTVVGIKGDQWLVLRTPRGREGRVLWRDLRGPGERPSYRLRLGYAVPQASLGKHRGVRIEAFPGGTENGGPFRRDVLNDLTGRTRLVIDADAERQAIRARLAVAATVPIDDDEIWEHVAANLSRRRSGAAAKALLRRACAMAAAAALTLRLACAKIEARVAAGLPPLSVDKMKRVIVEPGQPTLKLERSSDAQKASMPAAKKKRRSDRGRGSKSGIEL